MAKSNRYYDIELIDISENVDNFKFERISKKDLDSILKCFSSNEDFLSFSSLGLSVFLERKYFRGIMYTETIPKKKTIKQENTESAKEVKKIDLKKNNIFYKKEGGTVDAD